MLGAGAGFKVLEGMSTDIVMDAFKKSAGEFSVAYSGSAAQGQLNTMIANQTEKVADQIKNGIIGYVKGKLGMWTE